MKKLLFFMLLISCSVRNTNIQINLTKIIIKELDVIDSYLKYIENRDNSTVYNEKFSFVLVGLDNKNELVFLPSRILETKKFKYYFKYKERYYLISKKIKCTNSSIFGMKIKSIKRDILLLKKYSDDFLYSDGSLNEVVDYFNFNLKDKKIDFNKSSIYYYDIYLKIRKNNY